jgi:NADH oxidase (H2O2-forming)
MRVCIIGAGDAGATAANQIRRLNTGVQIDVFSNRVSLGCPPCEIPLALGGRIATWEELIRGFRWESFWEKRSINLHVNTEVTDISREDKQITAGGKCYDYDKLILALGAVPVIPPFPGLDGHNEFTLSTDMADGVALENAIRRHSEAAIFGGAFIALEVAEAFKARGFSKVHLLVRQAILRTYLDENMGKWLEEVIKDNQVELILPANIESVASHNERKRITLSDRCLETDFIFFATGAEPNAELAHKAQLQIGETGAIVTNQHLQTSDPDIYAIGDCLENWDTITYSKRRHQLATNAIRTGYIAGRNAILGNHITYEGTVMPFITKVFGHQIGAVGFTEREARDKGLDVVSVAVDTPRLRARFNGKPAHYKLIADAKSKTLIGAQIISEEMVSSTVDKLAVAIASKIPVMKLVQIDSSYSPHVQEDQVAVPLHRLIDKLESGGS